MKKKNINWLRLLAYFALLIISIILAPFILVVAPILALFFYKIKPNNQWLRNSLIASAAALIGTIVIFSIDTGETEANQSDLQPQEQVITSDQEADENSADDSESAAEEAAAQSAKDASQKSSKESYDKKLAAESSARQASSKKRAESESKEKAATESKAKAESEIASQASAEFTKVRTVPAGQTYIEINNNIPYFTDADITSTEAYESYGELDSLGRVTATTAPASGGDVSSVDANGNGQVTIKEAKAAGFSMPIYSDHWLYPYMGDRDGDGMVGE